jgi:hypothetical protein
MALVTAFYQTIEHRDGEQHVRHMTADVNQAIGAYLALGGRIIDDKNRRWVRDTLLGKCRTTDGHPAPRSYTSGHTGVFLRIEAAELTPEQALRAESHHRYSRDILEGSTQEFSGRSRQRSRP